MAPSNVSGALSPDLVRRYQSAMSRFRDTTLLSASTTPTWTTLSGTPRPGPKPASTSLNGSTRCTSDDLLERLATLATTPRGPDSAPLTTYTTTSTEHGEVYTATREYVDWLRRKIPGYGVEGAVSSPAAGRAFGGEGKIPVDL
jgi:hypothetical protein